MIIPIILTTIITYCITSLFWLRRIIKDSNERIAYHKEQSKTLNSIIAQVKAEALTEIETQAIKYCVFEEILNNKQLRTIADDEDTIESLTARINQLERLHKKLTTL